MTPVQGVPANQVSTVWPLIEELVKKGLGPDCGQSPDDLLTSLECEQAQLFVTPNLDCIMMTEIDLSPGDKVLNIFLAAGKLPEDYLVIIQALEGWAQSMACDAMEVRQSRPGFQRTFGTIGYRKIDGVLRKELH